MNKQRLFESVLKEYGFIHNEAPRIYREYKQLKREMKGVSVKVIKERLCSEYNVSIETLNAIIGDGLQRVRDKRRLAQDKKNWG